MSARILLVEDDRSIATVIGEALREEGYAVTTCETVQDRDGLLADRSYDVMLTDVMLKDGDGLSSIADVRKAAPDMPVIVLSAQNTLDTAVRATESDAFEYFPKPFDLDELVRAVGQACAPREAAASDDAMRPGQLPFIGRSQAMQGVYRLITRVMRNDLTVLVTGESGTGKELVAEAVHQLGHRRSGPFVAVNTAAIPRDLIESELFGHEKGAFTGATSQAIGKFEQANGGTLFLDEIGDMPPEAQTRLLRAIQSGRIRRVGGRHELAVDVRIVAATNRALEPLIRQGVFREDLFYRLNVIPIHMPPLRDRREDIGALVRHFFAQASDEGLPARSIGDNAISLLEDMPWRGNVRELRNAVFRLAVLARDEVVTRQTIREILGRPDAEDAASPYEGNAFETAFKAWLHQAAPDDGTVYHRAISTFEQPLFDHALRKTGGNQIAAARYLGINRNTLRKRLKERDADSPTAD